MIKGNRKYFAYAFILLISIIFTLINWVSSFYSQKQVKLKAITVQTVDLTKQQDLTIQVDKPSIAPTRVSANNITLDEKKKTIENSNPFNKAKVFKIVTKSNVVKPENKQGLSLASPQKSKPLVGGLGKTLDNKEKSEVVLTKPGNKDTKQIGDTGSNNAMDDPVAEEPAPPNIKILGSIRSTATGMATKFLLEDEKGTFTAMEGDIIDGYTINTLGDNLLVLDNGKNSFYYGLWNLDNSLKSNTEDIFPKLKLVGVFTDKTAEGEKMALCKIENDEIFLKVGDMIGLYVVCVIRESMVVFWDGETEKALYL